jgi:hypothetical protein
MSSLERGSKHVSHKVKQAIRIAVLHGAAYVRSRPFLKRRLAAIMLRFPFLRARLVRFAGAGVMQGLLITSAIRIVDSQDQLTAHGRAVYADLLEARRAIKK